MPSIPIAKSDVQILRLDQGGPFFRQMVERAPIGMALVTTGGRISYANRALGALLEADVKDCVNRDISESVVDDDRKVLSLRIDQVLRGEVTEFRIESRLHRKDATATHVVISASALGADEHGYLPSCILQFVDIDRERRAADAIARSESRLRFALEAAGQGVWDYDAGRDEIYHSSTWRTMRGMGPDEAVDPSREAWFRRLHPDDVERVQSVVDKQEHGDDGFDAMEYRERHRDGHYIWILSRGRPVAWDAEGRRTRAVGTDTDITFLKTIEGQLANEKERFRTTLESIADGVVSTDAQGLITFMNPPAEAMTGWTEVDAVGRPISEVFVVKHELTGENAADQVRSCLANGNPEDIESDVILVSQNGTGRGVAGTASPVKSDDGRTVGAVLVFKDITEAQEVQRQLAHSARHDALTGLPNRAAFNDALIEARRQAGTEQRTHALCFIDLDNFKPVNNSAGHAAGDALLQKVAQAIRHTCRAHDMAARLGGDEFVVLLADCPLAHARLVASKLVETIAKLDFRWNDAHYTIGASAGVTMIRPNSAQDAVAEANSACYAAKAAGRGRVSIFAA